MKKTILLIIVSFVLFFGLLSFPQSTIKAQTSVPCGTRYHRASQNLYTCDCSNSGWIDTEIFCCGWPSGSDCSSDPVVFNPRVGVTNETLDFFNPLITEGSPLASDLSTPGGIISRVLVFAFPLAGLILFLMIVWGGFEMMIGAANKKNLDSGKKRVTAALVGFLLLFASYWIVSIVQEIFAIKIL